MAQWRWLVQNTERYTWGFMLRVAAKAAALFVALNVIFALVEPLPLLGTLSIYNVLVPGRARLPYGENPAQSYNLSLNNLPAMFASHEIAVPRAEDEFRVLLMGDSATWGYLLWPGDTLTGALNEQAYATADGRRVRAYNLGYPIMSLTKDLLLLDYAVRYQPDLIVWLVTLESFPRDKQLFPPLVQNNPEATRRLIEEYALDLDSQDPRLVDPAFLDRTIVGRRRELNDLLRLQLYGIPWAITGIDQHYPEHYELRQSDFEEDVSWQDYQEQQPLTEQELAFDVLRAGFARAGDVPLLLINEPMFISSGRNSDLRYNFFYPRWAYDQYHTLIAEIAGENGWPFLDLWDALPPDLFTDSPVHYTPDGARQLAGLVGPAVIALADEGHLPQ